MHGPRRADERKRKVGYPPIKHRRCGTAVDVHRDSTEICHEYVPCNPQTTYETLVEIRKQTATITGKAFYKIIAKHHAFMICNIIIDEYLEHLFHVTNKIHSRIDVLLLQL